MNTTYVKVEASVEVRKEVLSCTLGTVKILRDYESFQKLRKKKAQTYVILKKQMKGLQENLQELRGKVPEIEQTMKVAEVKKENVKKPSVPRNDLDKLNLELRELEKRLKTL